MNFNLSENYPFRVLICVNERKPLKINPKNTCILLKRVNKPTKHPKIMPLTYIKQIDITDECLTCKTLHKN